MYVCVGKGEGRCVAIGVLEREMGLGVGIKSV